MGKIAVHEFITLDGVIEEPRWTVAYPFDPKMGEAIGGIMGSSKALLLGRRTFEMFAPAWSGRTAAEDPGAVAAEPPVEEGAVHLAEVGVELQVAGVEIRQTGVLTDYAALDGRPGYEEARGGAVIGAPAAVLVYAAAEFRERHQPHATIVAGRLQGLEKAADRVRQFG